MANKLSAEVIEHDGSSLADAEQPAVRTAAVHRILSEASDRGGGAALSVTHSITVQLSADCYGQPPYLKLLSARWVLL